MKVMKVGLSIPKLLVAQIDEQRGLVTRSRYVTHMLEQSLSNVVGNQKMVEGIGFQASPSTIPTGHPNTEVNSKDTNVDDDVCSLQSVGDNRLNG